MAKNMTYEPIKNSIKIWSSTVNYFIAYIDKNKMEVFEQIKLLFIVLMAFLSYRYVNTTLPLPPSIDSEEEEEC